MSTSPSALFERHRPKSPAQQFAVAAAVALLVLSLWLQFFLALEIEGIGRDIDVKTEELERLQRANLDMMNQITSLESQQRMAGEAVAMGFAPQRPLYLAVGQPLPRSASEAWESAFLTIWAVGVGKEAIAARAAEGSPDEPAEPAISVANVP
ncbi:MAG TPA: hypothetical protein VLC52_06475 [Anaerolineae bacterium]|nr:hypothetical protein [Anaerolineae bacterium]